MTADLPPDVRGRAFTAVKDALLGKGDVEPAKSSEFYNYVVSVVARPLQARIAELEAAVRAASDALGACRTCSDVEKPGDKLCVEKYSDRRSWCGVCAARAALDAVELGIED